MSCDELDALGAELMAADDAADPQRLAVIAWRLYSQVGVAQAEIGRLHSSLRSLRSHSGRPAGAARAGTCGSS